MDDRNLGLQLGRVVRQGRDVSAIVFIQMAQTEQLDDVTITEHAELFIPWATGVQYNVKDIVIYEGVLFRCVSAHKSQSDWTPTRTPALWVKIGDPGDEWPEWAQPLGAHDAYEKGAKVTYNDKRWVSTVDGNVYPPGVVAGQWEAVN